MSFVRGLHNFEGNSEKRLLAINRAVRSNIIDCMAWWFVRLCCRPLHIMYFHRHAYITAVVSDNFLLEWTKLVCTPASTALFACPGWTVSRLGTGISARR